MSRGHFLVMTYPAQGHINPNLELSKRLLRLGVCVTFVTSVHGRHFMPPQHHLPKGLNLVYYSDGYDDGHTPGTDKNHFMSEIKRRGFYELRQLMFSLVDNKSCRPVTCLAYSLILPWAATVAREFCVSSALIWIQPATVFDIYYHYFHGFDEILHELEGKDSSATITLPHFPLSFAKRDLPSFIMPNDLNRWLIHSLKEHMDELDTEVRPQILVNTFDALELHALSSIGKLKLTAVGPLVPSVFFSREGSSSSSVEDDSSQENKSSYIEWLDSMPDSSVIYVSFGSISVPSKQQMEEIGRALLDIGKPFLWIIRKAGKKEDNNANSLDNDELDDNKLISSCIDELAQLGLVLPWCSQVQVLSHPAISCFLTHCGWNSTLESLVSGVPMVGFPQWTDQGTNAKLTEEYWKTGVRLRENGDGVVGRDEIKRCLELAIGDEEMRHNCKKWKSLAMEASMEGGSSDKNLKTFVDEIAHSDFPS